MIQANQHDTLSALKSAHLETLIDRSYLALLRRPPDEGGRKHWFACLQDGLPLMEFLRMLQSASERDNAVGAEDYPLPLSCAALDLATNTPEVFFTQLADTLARSIECVFIAHPSNS